MQIKYSKPVLNPDGTIMVEQVIVLSSDIMSNGIKRRELQVIQELYPNVELLKETISKARENYQDLSLQGHKSVEQLEQEKRSLEELSAMVEAM